MYPVTGKSFDKPKKLEKNYFSCAYVIIENSQSCQHKQ